MSEREPVAVKNLDRYGAGALEWSRARGAMETLSGPAVTYFLGTCRPDGVPHAAGLGAMWYAGDLYFTSGPETRKARNLEVNPACTMSVRLEGIDLVLEGSAARTVEPEVLEALAARFRADGWAAEVESDALVAPFSAPSAGPPPWHLYRFRFHTVFGVAGVEPFGATRWRFGD
jgi:Pyridoxamine 5'-phosphate oxidase